MAGDQQAPARRLAVLNAGPVDAVLERREQHRGKFEVLRLVARHDGTVTETVVQM